MKFFAITKPGIIFGNIVTVCGGFFLGSIGSIHFGLLLATLIGMALIVGSGCVFNNVIDRDIDQLMERTCDRVLARGLLSPKVALFYGAVLGILGFAELYFTTNPLTVLVAGTGWFFYVVVYSLALKRKSTFGTTIGGVAGAVPPVVGYCAATNHFDLGAILLFLILFLWQMPHFYAISIYRLKDFKAASIPILPLTKNIHYTKVAMLAYIFVFTVAAVLPAVFGYAGIIYGVVAFLIGFIWFYLGIKGFKTNNDSAWARKIFGFSIIGITLLSIMMAVK